MSETAAPESGGSEQSPAAPSASVGPPRRRQRQPWQRLLMSPVAALMPDTCACCGMPAQATARVRRGRDAAELLVGYCGDCLEHAGRDGTRTLAVALSSLLLALTLAAAWPLLSSDSSVLLHLAVVLAAALTPLALSAVIRPRAPEGHSAWGRAVAFHGRELACARREYARELCALNPSARLVAAGRAPWFSPWMLSGVVLGACFALFLNDVYHPRLRVLNLSGERFELWVDGKRQLSVEPTSVESPAAGREIRLTAGPHHLEARSPDGQLVGGARVKLSSSTPHLFAPGSDGYCFWLERRSFGREELRITRTGLGGETRFWALPEGLDGWFTAPEHTASGDAVLSGGSATFLRQAPCAEAPPLE